MLQFNSNVDTVFNGAKFFWRTRTSADVVIVHHKHERVYEVIVYEPGMGMEAPRLYVDETALMSKVDSKLSCAKQNGFPLTEKFLIGVANKVVADFILNRLVILELVASDKAFVVGLRIDDCDAVFNSDVKELTCICPEALVAHQTKHFKQLMQGAVADVMQALGENIKNISESCDVADEMSARVTPIVHDRWRMPIVLNKVFHGLLLGAKDAKIFDKIKSNLKSDEDVARMKSVMQRPCRMSPRPAIMVREQNFQERALDLSGSHPFEPHCRAALAREPNFNNRTKPRPDTPLRAHKAREKSCQSMLRDRADARRPQEEEDLTVTFRYDADALEANGHRDIGSPKKTLSSSRFDTVISRSKAAFLESTAFTARSGKLTPKSGRQRHTFRLSSKPQHRTNRHPLTGDNTPEYAASPTSVSANHDGVSTASPFGRVVDGLAALGASFRSCVKFGKALSIGKIEEGCEEPAPTSLLAALLPSLDRSAEADAWTDAMIGAESYMSDSDADDALEGAFDTSVFQTKRKHKSFAYLGSFLLALIRGRSDERQATPPFARQGSYMSSTMYSWRSSRTVVPAQ